MASDLTTMDKIDKAEAHLVALGWKPAGVGESPDIVPVVHHFTPGLYARECFMPANALVISKTHKTEHPFVVSKGRCLVYTESGCEEIVAPHFGITKPGTRRALLILEDTVWTTFHPTNLTDVDEIEAEIIEQRHVPEAT